MKKSLQDGLSTTKRITVTENRTIDFLGPDPRAIGSPCAADSVDSPDRSGRVYATPSLIKDMETICRDLLLEHLDPGEDSLGIRVDIEHLAPTLLDMWVEITATIAKVEGRSVTFDISARDPVDEPVARGQHDRFVIDVEKTKQRLANKAATVVEAA